MSRYQVYMFERQPKAPRSTLTELLAALFVTPRARTVASEEKVAHPTCVGIERLLARIAAIDLWQKREEVQCTYVSGLVATRTNPVTGKREVLMVNGKESKTGIRKEFWQPPGGRVEPGEDHVAALHRELEEELRLSDFGLSIPPDISYHSTYVQKNKRYAVHAFRMENCTWDAEALTRAARERAARGENSDVDQVIWTDNPFYEEDGKTPRILTEQFDRILRQMGFTGPKNKNSPPDDYDGDPTN